MRELLLCPPDYYGIEYEINPWMSRARGAEAALAQKQWEGLHATLHHQIEQRADQPENRGQSAIGKTEHEERAHALPNRNHRIRQASQIPVLKTALRGCRPDYRAVS